MSDNKPTSLREILMDLAMSDFITQSRAMPRVDEAIAAITALLPEKYPPDSGFKKDEGYYHDVGFNEAINTIQRNFTGQTDNERSKYE